MCVCVCVCEREREKGGGTRGGRDPRGGRGIRHARVPVRVGADVNKGLWLNGVCVFCLRQ